MKFVKYWTATAIIACLAVFLYACGTGADDATTTNPFVFETWSEAEVFTLPTEPQEPASEGADSSDAKADTDTDTVLRRIEAARAVYGMFSESRPALDKEDSVEAEQGLFMYRVADPHFDTMEKLRAYVSGYFSDSITQQLLATGIFEEYDGKLYALDVGMQPTQKGEMHVQITEKTDTAEHYVLTVKGEKDQTYDFEYEKQKDGKWVFTRFQGY